MLGWLKRFLGPPVIHDPTLGFLTFAADEYSHYVKEDRDAFAYLFASVIEAVGEPPRCDVLFIYCAIDADGKIRRTTMEMREIIRISGASIVVFASHNEDCSYMRAMRRGGGGRANIVFTLNRKAGAFAKFFHNLFDMMQEGASMPVAWSHLAPQGLTHPDCPNTIFFCEAGQVSFASARIIH